MNFAFGGTGVFDTFINAPNMATQIDFFQQLLEEKVYTKQDLNSSIVLVSLAGNDYTTYIQRNGNFQVSLVNYLLFWACGGRVGNLLQYNIIAIFNLFLASTYDLLTSCLIS